eukprot:3110424-Pyramimonas_sp.AAC.1
MSYNSIPNIASKPHRQSSPRPMPVPGGPVIGAAGRVVPAAALPSARGAWRGLPEPGDAIASLSVEGMA